MTTKEVLLLVSVGIQCLLLQHHPNGNGITLIALIHISLDECEEKPIPYHEGQFEVPILVGGL
jgi:hypothetical protein